MRQYSTREVSELLDVRPHVLRYWEQEFSLISPRRDVSGRRVYTERDVDLLGRFRYLLYERRFTIEGAKNEIWEQINGRDPNVAAQVHQMRSDLLGILSLLRKQKP